jgi:V8-like Glu-specific endopeptidase
LEKDFRMKILSLIILSSMLLSIQAFAKSDNINVIYGEDNRRDVYDSPNASFIELSKSTAAMIKGADLKSPVNGVIEIEGTTLEGRGVCAQERFSKQVTAANCSGFLVSGNRLVTAGHCIKTEADCSSYKWVFDFKVDYAEQGKVNVAESSVYSCKKIISRKLDSNSKDDYAYIELDRVVTDRSPLKIRTSGKIAKGDALVVIGHPTGLPTKISDGANVRNLSSKFFTANLDTYGGNSGSAVFNVETEEVEGILVRGETDYVYDSALGCQVSNVCAADGCRGEDVTYIKNVEGL